MKSIFYLKNVTFIFKFDIKKALQSLGTSIDESCCATYKACTVEDAEIIADFYHKQNRLHYSLIESIIKQYDEGALFHALLINSEIVAGLWIHSGLVMIDSPSFYAFQQKRSDKIKFNLNVIFGSSLIVTPEFRGKHLYTYLLNNIFKYYKGSDIDTYVFTTGIDNKKMLHSSFYYGAFLIGIVKTTRLFHTFWFKKKYYFDNKGVCWKVISK